MSALTASIGGKYEFKFKDKTYQVSLLTKKVKSAFEKRMLSKALEGAQTLKVAMSSQEFREFLEGINDRFCEGYYSYENVFNTIAQTENNIKYSDIALTLLGLLFNLPDEEMTELYREANVEVANFLNLILRESTGTGMPVDEGLTPDTPESVDLVVTTEVKRKPRK
jgi:hypothetical protein